MLQISRYIVVAGCRYTCRNWASNLHAYRRAVILRIQYVYRRAVRPSIPHVYRRAVRPSIPHVYRRAVRFSIPHVYRRAVRPSIQHVYRPQFDPVYRTHIARSSTRCTVRTLPGAGGGSLSSSGWERARRVGGPVLWGGLSAGVSAPEGPCRAQAVSDLK